ncbi:hypothetical protein [Amycolatopsis sp. FDAARGOS 1241]|uniref:hypothetical protein n=1 Tax=Amycolatopsis sp. FDAARGOS 1241 TaxID=2778070 RepID=UPI00194E8A82|nr:hypothetical protein [Amycolatopsis sp. FDAARGOS 1241]QRP47968.1 hypothetical protein I6J71_08795 [Amycolatopsis sp. FDAARGOS 1241]
MFDETAIVEVIGRGSWVGTAVGKDGENPDCGGTVCDSARRFDTTNDQVRGLPSKPPGQHAAPEHKQRLGRLDATADPTRLAHTLLAAYQGGMLLAQIARDIAPLRNALYAAVDYVETFAIYPDADEPRAQ